MDGVIRRRDIVAHPLVTVRCFGWRVFFRTLTASRGRTFLSLLAESQAFEKACEGAPALVDRSIDLELRAAKLYENLARRFFDHEDLRRFFQTLVTHERDHADLLRLCRAGSGRSRWAGGDLALLAAAVPRLEGQMHEVESNFDSIETVKDAFEIAIQIESSEVNQLFNAIGLASPSEFVRSLDAFRRATREHIAYICRRIPEMEPSLDPSCRELREAQSGGGV